MQPKSPTGRSHASCRNASKCPAPFVTLPDPVFGNRRSNLVRGKRPRLHRHSLIRVHSCSSVVAPTRSESGARNDRSRFEQKAGKVGKACRPLPHPRHPPNPRLKIGAIWNSPRPSWFRKIRGKQPQLQEIVPRYLDPFRAFGVFRGDLLIRVHSCPFVVAHPRSESGARNDPIAV
jgi:hypothetical protein